MEAIAYRNVVRNDKFERHGFTALETVLTMIALAVWGLAVPMSLLGASSPLASFG